MRTFIFYILFNNIFQKKFIVKKIEVIMDEMIIRIVGV